MVTLSGSKKVKIELKRESGVDSERLKAQIGSSRPKLAVQGPKVRPSWAKVRFWEAQSAKIELKRESGAVFQDARK